MKATRTHWAALTTAPDAETARRLARAAVEGRLAACANLVPGVESHYWWKGAVEAAAEVLLIFKTERARLPDLEKRIHELHPYETPAWVAWPMAAGSSAYLDWITASVAAGPDAGLPAPPATGRRSPRRSPR